MKAIHFPPKLSGWFLHGHALKFVREEGARTHEKAGLQNPYLKKIMLNYSNLCAEHFFVIYTFH